MDKFLSLAGSGKSSNEAEYLEKLTSSYMDVLDEQMKKNEKEQDNLLAEIKKLEEAGEQLTILSKKPEWPDSFIPVNPLAYVSGTIIHTGEHNVQLGPDTYSLMSLHETLGLLQRKIEAKVETLEMYRQQHKQLQQRNEFMHESNSDLPETAAMPLQIASDKGVAHKTVAGFYEVLEAYDENGEKEFYKRRERNKTRPKQKQRMEGTNSDSFFKRLDELEKQESLRRELGDENKGETSTYVNSDLCNRIKTMLRQSGVYDMLLNDDCVQAFCSDKKTTLNSKGDDDDDASKVYNETILNDIIVQALINVVNIKKSIDFKATDESEHISSKELKVLDFLDTIESNMK